MRSPSAAQPRALAAVTPAPRPAAAPATSNWLAALHRTVHARHLAVLAFVLVFPFVATPFITFQVAAQSLVLGLIALSLTFLGGYGGMVSLAQMTVAGIAGYALAVLGTSSSGADIALRWPWWVAVPFALFIATLCATLIGWLSVRTEGIYTIMITLAIGVAFYYLVLQNYSIFNGFQGLREIYPPKVFGIGWRDPVPFYFLCLACAMAGYFLVKWVVRAPFGVALQGIRDNPRRMAALGYHVVAHRVAAYALAGLLAAVGGVLLVWYNGLITPGSVSTSWLINILVVAVLGGMRHPIGAFLGAIVFVLLQTFAIDLIDRERFNLLIGGVFFAIVLFSPDGLLGLWAALRARLGSRPGLTSNQRRQP
ncbi:branched-chain amino acid ABC transporter permease [Variovorax sp. JS1663]|uniref:branched-chain amino acid ABC transporter permease n=1 Tax=Variovorax sp. JS1663 TaxID=1851577 RepID=UPI000B6EED4D|nr:branched-chain amino acid ABC transporter permease [Variovorax sp. JS1663]OUL98247.1 ABC transporter ATP-binding protein [Variovorax sp. JS1663]